MIRRFAGMVIHPRATLAGLMLRPRWVDIWLAILIIWAVIGWALLATDVGQQALVDERVRRIEVLGGSISDSEYAALLANPPWWVYPTSAGRLLLTPIVTLLVALVLWRVARAYGRATSWSQALAVAVHASVVLLIGQLVATPFHYVRESLTSPLNLAAVLPVQDGTLPARFFGTLDLFALWWGGVLAIGLSVLTQRPATRFVWPIVTIFLGVAGVVVAVIAARGGY